MKALVIVARDSSHPAAAGGDRHMTLLASQLAERGDSVTLLTAGHPTLPAHEQRGNLRIERVGTARLMFPLVWIRELTSYHGRFDVVLEEAMGGERAPFLGRFLSGSPTMGFWYQDNRSLISVMYGRAAAKVGGWVQDLLLRAGRTGYAIGNSRFTAEWLVSRGFEPDRVAVSFPVIDPSLAPKLLPSFNQRHNRITTIGNIRSTKRFEEALEVLRRVRAIVPDAELDIIGREPDARYLERLRKIALQGGIASAVRFHISASDEEKFSVLSQSKVLTIHSPIEGLGWTVLEAGLCGVPTVGNVGVSPDALKEGVNGVRLRFGDVHAYAQSIVQLFGDEARWKALSDGAQQVASEFTAGPLNQGVIDLMRRCAR